MKIIAELSRHIWAMEQRALDAFLEKIRGIELALLSGGNDALKEAILASSREGTEDGRPSLAFLFDEEPQKKSRMVSSNGVASIPISGVLMKSVPKVFRWFNIDATSYKDIEGDIAQAMGDQSVKSIRLVVDSPGGQVAGVKETADAIAAARAVKPVSAEVTDLAASAAYWLAAQAGRISASPNALVGSIGVYSVYVDTSKAAEAEGVKVHVVSSGAHKGMGIPGAPITEGQLAAVQEVIDGMAANFVADVARGRGRQKGQVAEWASGRVWLASEAAKLGLIDSVGVQGGSTNSLDFKGEADVRPAASSKQEETMTKEEMEAASVKASQDAVAAERKRTADIKAAFPKHPEFALAQIESGATLESARGAHSAIVLAENEKLAQENADLKSKAAVAAAKPATSGAPPIPSGADPSASNGKDFMAVSRTYMAEKKCSMAQAMSYIARTQPELHAGFLAKQQERAGEVNAKKKALGMA